MKKTIPLKIYLGDLTYTTVTLATEAFPLNVGYIASYCKKLFGRNGPGFVNRLANIGKFFDCCIPKRFF